MATKRLTKLEQFGIVIVIIVIGVFFYLKLVDASLGKKLKRTERDWGKLSTEVSRLRSEEKTGRIEGEIRKLRKKVSKVKQGLKKAEIALTKDSEVDEIANRIVHTAAQSGLMIKKFDRITDKNKIKEISKENELYKRRYYNLTLQGRFNTFRSFIKEISQLKFNEHWKLIVIKKIALESLAEKKAMKAELWLSI
ncbi:MAG: type 4a pilus biogenesis protein PilO [Thermodesulfobacteriota bacterium]|nr:type 4a pilus biogenesis protein PilO [Thermodesulfobacteriota bacterium]